MAHLERVSKAVEEAKATGHIKVITGGEKRKGNGYYYAPTLLAGALQDARHRAKKRYLVQ
ncbi:aldehyde dehydrogenase family protein [Escherichia coli]